MPTPLEKEILAEFDSITFDFAKFGAIYLKDHTMVGPEYIRNLILSALARQRDSFLTMLPPEKWRSRPEEPYIEGEIQGWNDYRRELLAKMGKHD